MCTVTIIRDDATLRLACNRDELRTRAAAEPPTVRAFGERRALMPIDPVSGGTWIAVNDAGLALTLLNVNLESPPINHVHHRSRGRIIPSLLALTSVDAALDAAAGLDPALYPPFRLVVLDRHALGDVYSDGAAGRVERISHDALPVMFASSGLGDHIVDPPRRELFTRMFDAEGQSAATQDAFHRHTWADRTELSVCMSRSDAMTVSYTAIELGGDAVAMRYQPGLPTHDAAATTLTLALHEAYVS